MMQYGQFQNQGGWNDPTGISPNYQGMGGGYSPDYQQESNAYGMNPSMFGSSLNMTPMPNMNMGSGVGAQAPSGSSFGSNLAANPWGAAGAAGGLIGGLAGLFNNPYKAGQGYLNQVPGYLQQAYGPYMQEGQNLLGPLTSEFSQFATNPGQNLAQIGAGYQSSPGYNFQVGQATGAANRSAAAGGMVGSGANQVQTAGIANQLANQDYQQYMQNALGVQSQGLQGEMGLENQGFNAASNYGMGMSDYAAEQAGLANQAAQNQNNAWGGLGAGLGYFASLF